MQWVEWTDDKLAMLEKADWMMEQGTELLQLRSKNKVTIGPESYLYSGMKDRFDRIISMCAWIEHPEQPIAGMKWISSKAANVDLGLPRGGAVTVLNNAVNGYPLLAYDGSPVSLARTAMVNCLALKSLFGNQLSAVAFIGAGRVNDWQAKYIRQLWPDVAMGVYDVNSKRAWEFIEMHPGCGRLIHWKEMAAFDAVCIATTSVGWIPRRHYVSARSPKVWVHTSLRDMQPRLEEQFGLVVVDDHELAISEGTSHGYAWRENWVRKEVTLQDLVISGYKVREADYPILINPMGLAMWDIGIGWKLWRDEFYWAQAQMIRTEAQAAK